MSFDLRLIFTSILLFVHQCDTELTRNEYMQIGSYRLYKSILRSYNRDLRPLHDPTKPLIVGMYMYLYQIFEVNQQVNTIMLAGSFELFWKDEFLTWDPDKYDGVTELFMPPNKIWIPELAIYYSPSSGKMLQSDNMVRLNYTGSIRWWLPFAVTSFCPIDVQLFPFDVQKCELMFGPWAYTTDMLHFVTYNVDQKDYYDNQEWLLESATFHSQVVPYTYLGNELNFTFAIVTLNIARQSFYYVFNLVIPAALIAYVSVIGFHMPGSSGVVRDAKYRLGIMTILSMIMLLLSIVGDMPKFSMQRIEGHRGSFSGAPLIGIYYFTLVTIIGVSTVTTSTFVAMERCVRKMPTVPVWIAWLAYQPRFFGYKPVKTTSDVESTIKSYPTSDGQRALQANSEVIANRFAVNKDSAVPGAVQYVQPAIIELKVCMERLETVVGAMRQDLRIYAPGNNMLDERWVIIQYRLEKISLVTYICLISLTMIMFFHHGWYKP